jgi:hypothetical protein
LNGNGSGELKLGCAVAADLAGADLANEVPPLTGKDDAKSNVASVIERPLRYLRMLVLIVLWIFKVNFLSLNVSFSPRLYGAIARGLLFGADRHSPSCGNRPMPGGLFRERGREVLFSIAKCGEGQNYFIIFWEILREAG